VASIHAAALWVLATQTLFHHAISGQSELQLTLFNPRLPPSAPRQPWTSYTFKLPDEVDVTEPQIEIKPDSAKGSGSQANEMTERLAPTLDPTHVNERPELPGTLGRLIAELALRLDILVLPDGTVLNVHIVKSTGVSEIDKLAIEWIRNNWRFLPALQNGQAIQAWTTVMARFAPIH